jgi:hypothetical protein
MSQHAYDHRLVQTAVIGHSNSDLPVILPMDAHELDFWRKSHPSYTYWCGLQLGGCGGELSDKRYTDKVCHFAHHPSAPVCYRTANGESSADHLFIKQGVRRLLDREKVRGTVRTRDLGTGPGDAVDVRIRDRHLRFQLSGLDYRAWRRAADELAAEVEGIDWIFSTDGPITQDLLGRHGYCLRVRCETVGGERRVHIGVEARDRVVSWTPLEDCELTASGIMTPQVEQIRLSQPPPKPFAFPVQGSLVFALVPGSPAPVTSPFAAEGRHLLVADVKPVDSPIVRTLVSLPGDTEPPPAHHVYRVPDGARILVTENGGSWAVDVKRFVRLDAHEAQRTGLWTPSPRNEAKRPEPAPAAEPVLRRDEPPTPTRAAPPAPSSSPASDEPTHTAPEAQLSDEGLVSAVREALITHARLRSTTTWGTLTRTVGADLGGLSRAERERLLVAVDTPLRDETPVLSALIRYNGEPLPYLAQVLIGLGVPYVREHIPLNRWAAVETERAFAVHGTPPRDAPPRYSLRPGQQVVNAQNLKLRSRSGTGEAQLTEAKRRASQNALDTDYVRSAVKEIERLWPRLSKKARKSLNSSWSDARKWLMTHGHEGKAPTRPRRRRAAYRSAAQHAAILAEALAAARKDAAKAKGRARSQPASKQPAAANSKPSGPVESALASASAARANSTERLTRQLIAVAARGTTIKLLDLEDAQSLPERSIRRRLQAVDSSVTSEVPLLSSLVTDPNGEPVPFFRKLLGELGFAVPRTDEALSKIWRREQERCHAAYGALPRPLPPRLVPREQKTGRT